MGKCNDRELLRGGDCGDPSFSEISVPVSTSLHLVLDKAPGPWSHGLQLFSCSVMSNSLRPQGFQHTSLLCSSLALGVCSNFCPLDYSQFSSVAQSCMTLRPHEPQHTRLPCSSLSLGVCSDSCLLDYSEVNESRSVVSDSLQPHGLSMDFSRPQYWSGYWSGQPFPSPRDLPNPGTELRSPSLRADSLPAEPQGKPCLQRWSLISLFPHLSSHRPSH